MNKRILLLLIICCPYIVSCEKEEYASKEYPRLTTLAITDISSNGATFQAEIISQGEMPITEYGFIWSEYENPVPITSEIKVISDNLDEKTFSSNITYGLKKNVIHYVRAFVKSGTYTVYGNPQSFVSMGSEKPLITDFHPLKVYWGDTLTINGKNFSTKPYVNNVKLGEINAIVLSASDTLLKVIVPARTNNRAVKISLSMYNYTCFSPSELEYIIQGVNPGNK